MKNLNTTPVSRLSLFKLFWHFVRSAPLPFAANILLRLVNAGNRGFQPVVIAGFTNALINAEDLELWCGVYLVLISLDLLSDVLNTTTQMWFSNKAVLYFQQRLLRHVTEIPLLDFLEPDFHDDLNRATHGFSHRITNYFQSLLGNVHSIVSICGLFGSVLVLGGGVKCLSFLLVSSLIIFLTRIPVAKIELARDRSTAYLNRTQDAWAAHLYERDSAPEVRLFSIQHWILSKWEKAYKHLADIDMEALKGKTRWNLLATLSSVIGYSAIIFLAAHTATAAKEKEIAGVFTGLITAAVTLQGFLSYAAQAVGNLSEHSGVLRDLAPLFTTPPPKTEKHQDNALPDPGIQAEMNAISFQYPRATTQTLKHITAKIAHGEVVALVGKNGAGKTTLANLLLGLYTPDTGTLKFSENTDNGISRSAVFQNFVRYRLPVRDNIGFADINHIENDDRIQHMLEKVDSTFANELDTWLGHEFGGRDASNGEWLRIAVARGLFRESPFIVFDEPTASIDPIAVLKENGWQGKTILKALGGFPRGASNFRGAMPYLYRSDVVWFTCMADMQIYESLVTHDGTQPEAICIPYHMDPDTYQPLKSSESRQKLRNTWGFKQDDFVLVYAGRVTIEKNVHAIIEAVAELTRLGEPVKLVLVGKIENVPFREFQMHPVNVEEKIKTLIENAGVSDRVVIQEWQTPEKLNEVFNAADAFINLTLHHDENFGLSQIEAMSAGLPVIGTAWGGLKDTIINQEVGFAIDTWVTKNGIRFDAPAVMDAIKCLMENRQLCEIQGQRAREHAVANYNNSSYRKQLTQLIETILHESMQSIGPSFTPFGSRFHQRFARKGYVPKHSSRARAPDPVYESLSDPDYMELIISYTSRTEHTMEPNSHLFRAMTGQLNGKFFISEDLLYSLRIPIVSEEADVIHQLNRWQNVPRQGLNLSNELLNRLIQKGVIGVSKEIQ